MKYIKKWKINFSLWKGTLLYWAIAGILIFYSGGTGFLSVTPIFVLIYIPVVLYYKQSVQNIFLTQSELIIKFPFSKIIIPLSEIQDIRSEKITLQMVLKGGKIDIIALKFHCYPEWFAIATLKPNIEIASIVKKHLINKDGFAHYFSSGYVPQIIYPKIWLPIQPTTQNINYDIIDLLVIFLASSMVYFTYKYTNMLANNYYILWGAVLVSTIICIILLRYFFVFRKNTKIASRNSRITPLTKN